MTTENYEKSNTKRRSYQISIEFVDFLEVSRYRQLYRSVRYFLMLHVHVKILQNNQQIKKLQAANKTVSGSPLD